MNRFQQVNVVTFFCGSLNFNTLKSSAQGNVPGTPERTWSISLQKISDDAESLKGKRTKQYFLKGVLNAVRSFFSPVATFCVKGGEVLAIFETVKSILPRSSVVNIADQVLV